MLMPTDAAYNNTNSRSVSWKADMYILGTNRPPLELTKSNYIVDIELLEETSADSDTPFGDVTANEITLTLLNANGIFSPTNSQSDYYGYMRKGIKICLFSRPGDEYEWHQLGEFYVTQWTATVTGITASITASDKLYSIFERPSLNLPVKKSISYKAFFSIIFNALHETANIDDTLQSVLPMAYNTFTNNALLSKLSVGAMADCFCDHTGNIVVKALLRNRELRATLTDAEQIIDVNATHDLTTDFDGASVACNVPAESGDTSLYSMPELSITSGEHTHGFMQLTTVPMIRMLYASLVGTSDATIENIDASSLGVTITTRNNAGSAVNLPLEIHGTTVSVTTSLYSDVGTSLLEVDNEFVQQPTYAITFKQLLQRFVSNETPTLVVQIRGNPLLELSDKVRIISQRYNLDYTGIIIRQEHHYDGALSCSLTLLNADILEVMS